MAVAVAGLEALFPSAFTTPIQVAVLAMAAAVEEIVFRAELPAAIAAAVDSRSPFARDLWGSVVAQLSFAVTHLALHGGIAGQDDLLEILRLSDAGRRRRSCIGCWGLVPAALLHASMNYATYTSRFGVARYPSQMTIVISAGLLSVAMAMVVKSRPALPLP